MHGKERETYYVGQKTGDGLRKPGITGVKMPFVSNKFTLKIKQNGAMPVLFKPRRQQKNIIGRTIRML
jgi:hypothetical protein